MDKTEFFVYGLKTLPTNQADIKPGGLYFIQMGVSDMYELYWRNKANTDWLQLGNVNKGEFIKTFNGLYGDLLFDATLNNDNNLEITITDGNTNEVTVVNLDVYATKDWVDNKGFLVSSDLNGLATEQWVQNQNYLTQHQDISGKADKTVSITGVGALEGGGSLASSSSLDLTQDTKDDIAKGVLAEGWGNHADAGYATETWVSSQGFLTQHQSLSGYATETWVSSQGFSTQTLDNIEDTTEGVKVTGQVQANALIGRATNSNASGTYTIDFNNLSENYNLVLIGNTIISFTNMIAEDETAVFTLVVEGDFNFSVTGLDLDLDGDVYSPSGRNLIVIHIEKGGANYRGTYTIKNI